MSFGHDSCTPNFSKSGYDSSPGISVNTESSTPLHLAAAHTRTACVEFLCEAFPQAINRRDKNGATPLMLASQSSNLSHPLRSTTLVPPTTQRPRSSSNSSEDVSTVAALLHFGASPTAADYLGNTALHYASAWGNLKAFRLLVGAGAPPLARNHAMCTPADYALSVQAAVYFRGLVSEFERLRTGDQPPPPPPPPLPPQTQPSQPLPPMKTKLQIKVKESDIGHAVTNGSHGGASSSPVSPTESRLRECAKNVPTTSGIVGGVRLVPQSDDESPVDDAPLTAKRVGWPDDQFPEPTRNGRRFSS